MKHRTRPRGDVIEHAADAIYREQLGAPGRTVPGGRIKGDAADAWLRDNDPRRKPEIIPKLGADSSKWQLQELTRNDWRRRTGLVYFVQVAGGGPIKIGLSNTESWEMRYQRMQTDNPLSVGLLRQVRGDRSLERRIHAHFAPIRIKGEWFKPDPELVALATPDLLDY